MTELLLAFTGSDLCAGFHIKKNVVCKCFKIIYTDSNKPKKGTFNFFFLTYESMATSSSQALNYV